MNQLLTSREWKRYPLALGVLVVAMTFVVGACSLPFTSSEDFVGDALKDEDVVLLLPESVPAGFGLWDLRSLTGPSGTVDGAISFYAAGEVIVQVCAAGSSSILLSMSSGCLTMNEGTQVVRGGSPVTVVAECISEVCTGFNAQEWLNGFGYDPPVVSDIERI